MDKSLVHPAQLEITLYLPQPLALLVHPGRLEQSLLLVLLSAQVNAAKASTVLLDRRHLNKTHVEMLASFVLLEAVHLLPCLLDSTLALSPFHHLNERHPSLALTILACALAASYTQH